VSVCTCLGAYMQRTGCTHANKHACDYLQTHANEHTFVHTNLHAYRHTYEHVYIQTKIHAYLHTCIVYACCCDIFYNPPFPCVGLCFGGELTKMKRNAPPCLSVYIEIYKPACAHMLAQIFLKFCTLVLFLSLFLTLSFSLSFSFALSLSLSLTHTHTMTRRLH